MLRVAASRGVVVCGTVLTLAVVTPPDLDDDEAVLLHEFNGSPAQEFAHAVSGAGDVNGDGYDDLLVGAPLDGGAGSVRVYSGETGTLLFTLFGAGTGDRFGHAVAGLGDVDDDGFDDFAVGAPFEDNPAGTAVAGSVRVYAGTDGAGPPAVLFVLYGDDGGFGFGGTEFGIAVSAVGDADGDCLPDLAVGAPLQDVGQTNAGRVSVVRGFTGSFIVHHYGVLANERLGSAVAPAGDIGDAATRDGLHDVVAGAPGLSTGFARVCDSGNGGFIHEFTGPQAFDGFGQSVGGGLDVDGDLVPDVVVGAPLGGGTAHGRAYLYSGEDGSLLHTYEGDAPGDQLGTSVAIAGDVDVDLRADVLLGIPRPSLPQAGSAVVYSGRQPDAELRRMSMDGTTPGDAFGAAVAAAGDVDGNCSADVIVAAPVAAYARVYGYDFEGRPSANRVAWPGGEPLVDVPIEATYLIDTDPSPGAVAYEVVPLPRPCGVDPTLTDENGEFCWPPELTLTPKQTGEIDGGRSVRAHVTYTEITGDDSAWQIDREIVNYPGHDPFVQVGTPFTGAVTITYPHPVLFQPGVWGELNKGYHGWSGSAGLLRGFLVMDAGATDDEIETLAWNLSPAFGDLLIPGLLSMRELKRGKGPGPPLPAFLFFGMPSENDDDVSWGYKNNAVQWNRRVKRNTDRLGDHYDERIAPELAVWTPDDTVPMAVTGHSMGGVLGRDFIVHRDVPPVARFVSFDAPQGGVKWDIGLASPFFRETRINGVTKTENIKPTGDDRGWNYAHSLSVTNAGGQTRLFLSAPDNNVITGDATGTAMAVGRVMEEPRLINLWSCFLFNDYCERFAAGWHLPVHSEGHSIQNVLHPVLTAARFLATGSPPFLGTAQAPESDDLHAALHFVPGDQCPESGSLGTTELPSRVRYEMNASAGASVTRDIDFDSAGTFGVAAFVKPAEATVSIEQGGRTLDRVGEVVEEGEGGSKFVTFEVDAAQGPAELKLTAGVEDASTIARVEFPDRYHVTAGLSLRSIGQGLPVWIRVQMVDGTTDPYSVVSGAPAGSSSVDVTVLDPDGVLSGPVTMYDDGQHNDEAAGDFIYGGSYLDTLPIGHYEIHVEMALDLGGGTVIRRTTAGGFTVDPDDVACVDITDSPADIDFDGDDDEILFDVAFTVGHAGSYLVLGELWIGETYVQSLTASVDVPFPGVAVATFRVDENVVHETGGGAFAIRNVEILDGEVDVWLGACLDDISPTSYNPADFDPHDVPEVTVCMPDHGSAAGGETVIVRGRELDQVTSASLGSQPASFTIRDEGTLEIVTPPWVAGLPAAELRLGHPWGPDVVRPGCFRYGPAAPVATALVAQVGTVVAGAAGSLGSLDFSFVEVLPEAGGFQLVIVIETDLCAELFDIELGGIYPWQTTSIAVRDWVDDAWFDLPPLGSGGGVMRYGPYPAWKYQRPSDGRFEIRLAGTVEAVGLPTPAGSPGGIGVGAVSGPSSAGQPSGQAAHVGGASLAPGHGPPKARIDLVRVVMQP